MGRKRGSCGVSAAFDAKRARNAASARAGEQLVPFGRICKRTNAEPWRIFGRRQPDGRAERHNPVVLRCKEVLRMDGHTAIPSSRAAFSPSIPARSASVRPGVDRMWSTEVWVQGNG